MLSYVYDHGARFPSLTAAVCWSHFAFVEEETMTRDEKGTSYDGEEHIKFIEPIFEDMTKNIMIGFEFLAIQSWEKYIYFKKTKGKNASVCLKGQKEETHEPPSSEMGEVEEVVHEED